MIMKKEVISIVVPCYNEEESLPIFYEAINKVSKEISMGTREYADALLERLEEILKETLTVIHDNRKELK